MTYFEKIDFGNIPQHVAIIMDGNGRWAKKKGKNRLAGHRQGAYSVKDTVEAAIELKIKYITLYAFSTENWNRPKKEVEGLMTLLVRSINEQLDKLMEQNIRLHTIGDNESLPPKVLTEVNKAINASKNNTGLNLIIALSYSSRWEILNAVRNILDESKNKEIFSQNITEKFFSEHLTTFNFPDPDLLIRTSGEQRISNFLLWQLSYSELYFTETLWPDFNKEEFFKAIFDYQQRERRYGKTTEQIILKK
jgi:undecaprenyl diphosphate synthase